MQPCLVGFNLVKGNLKKSTLTLFILLALYDKAAWSGELAKYIEKLTGGHLAVDLAEPSPVAAPAHRPEPHRVHRKGHCMHGPKRKTYGLTAGERVLRRLARSSLSYAWNPNFVDNLTALATESDPVSQ